MYDIPESSVLGIVDFGSVSGSPLVPPSYLTFFFLVFLGVFILSYLYFYIQKRPVLLWHKVRLLFILAVVIMIIAIGGGSALAAYWLVPTPQVRRTTPKNQDTHFSPINRIEIVFDRPVERAALNKTISPEVPGRWVFENSLYTTHLYRKLVFYPTYSLKPETQYTVTLSGIKNLIGFTQVYDYQFNFTTQNSPKVEKVIPEKDMLEVDTNTPIEVKLDSPNKNVSQFDFRFDPTIEYTVSLDTTDSLYTLTPITPLKQGTKYNLTVQKSDVILNLEEGTIFERAQETEEYIGSFTTKNAPGITSFEPQSTNAPLDPSIKLVFSREMNRKSVTDNFSIEPHVSGQFIWTDNTTATFRPNSLQYETVYKVTIEKGAEALNHGFLEEDSVNTFKTIGAVKVALFNPQNGWTAVNVHSPLDITFDQEVDHTSAESKFSITPSVSGSFKWNDAKMTFVPNVPLAFSTSYTVTLASDIRSINGQNSKQEYKSVFTTQDSITKLAVPAYLQKYTLSCEIASLRMALHFRGVNVSEDDIIPKVGLDPTPHKGNIWGNPNSAFVGNIRGTQMVDGYGVHWAPIAKAARNYRNAETFEGMSIEQLTKELVNNNPVVLWVYSHNGIKTAWNTPDGTSVYAVRDEHAVVAVGFVGPFQNPTQLIINDPLVGQVYWSRAVFDKKWNIFNRSGVVVY